MKRYNFKTLRFALAVALLAGLASCSDDFLQEKRDYNKVGTEIYNDFTTAEQRVNYIYTMCRPHTSGDPTNWRWAGMSTGNADDLSKCTEEYSGFGTLVDPQITVNTISGTAAYQFFGEGGKVQGNPFGVIRSINDCIEGIEAGTLSQAEKDELLGQLYFMRAWRYFALAKWMGGVPVIDHVLLVAPESTTQRSSAKETFEFILNDLRTAAEKLKDCSGAGQWLNGEKYGRVTYSSALALKGRVLMWWCSPLFNRSGDQDRYQKAYEEMKEDLAAITNAGHGLVDASTHTALGWADMFNEVAGNIEAIFLTRYNNVAQQQGFDANFNNSWESGIRPSNCGGSGKTPSAMIVDMFPMKDGGVPNNSYFATTKLKRSEIQYNENFPFADRDPRFYRTFGFPGIKWPYSGNFMSEGSRAPFSGNEYELWNYVWYETAAERDNAVSTSQYGADNLLSSVKGMYVSKRSTGSVNKQLYPAIQPAAGNAFQLSYASYIEIRYAEVLLNFAEVACGAGKWQEAVPYLQQIRERVGYTGDCGLNITNDASCMAAILYERQIEFAFEGKRFDDMRRWLLFDGGTRFSEIPGAPSTWTLTGWNGDTCAWLGFAKFNGQHRDNMEFRVNDSTKEGLGGKEWKSFDEMPDPIAKQVIEDGEATDWNSFKAWRTQNYAVDMNGLSSEELYDRLNNNLKVFYTKYLTRKLKPSDLLSDNNTKGEILFKPHYYFYGLNHRAQNESPTLLQTIGWEDAQRGGTGTFDPLAE